MGPQEEALLTVSEPKHCTVGRPAFWQHMLPAQAAVASAIAARVLSIAVAVLLVSDGPPPVAIGRRTILVASRTCSMLVPQAWIVVVGRARCAEPAATITSKEEIDRIRNEDLPWYPLKNALEHNNVNNLGQSLYVLLRPLHRGHKAETVDSVGAFAALDSRFPVCAQQDQFTKVQFTPPALSKEM